ncbi:Uncharacterised protein [Vibrio cholerae]|uniref:Uncharacterized protein n=1 Tax=Vibrio cholerae TaxID=666 RepID=A0A655ZB10_VIBCL|nr:hypothetical protein VCHC55B2_0193 [Vibrio cholerae HC-55B2]CSC63099.1 Uncharacterised protein [Vibrio cholerae]
MPDSNPDFSHRVLRRQADAEMDSMLQPECGFTVIRPHCFSRE